MSLPKSPGNNVCYFEARRHQDLFMHLARVPHGPTFKFQVLNIHTADEVRLSGNCLLGSRPLLTFDESFEKLPHLTLMKEMFIQVGVGALWFLLGFIQVSLGGCCWESGRAGEGEGGRGGEGLWCWEGGRSAVVFRVSLFTNLSMRHWIDLFVLPPSWTNLSHEDKPSVQPPSPVNDRIPRQRSGDR